VPPEVQGTLGVTAEAAPSVTFFHPSDVAPDFGRRFRDRRDALAACLPAGRRAWTGVAFGADRRPGALRLAGKVDPDSQGCVARALAQWSREDEAPAPGFVFAALFGTGPALPAAPATSPPPPGGDRGVEGADDDRPEYPSAGWTKASVEPGCVQRAITKALPENEWLGVVTMMLAVGKDGTVSQLRLLTPAPTDVAVAVARGLRDCPWAAASRDGNRAASWVVIPIRLRVE